MTSVFLLLALAITPQADLRVVADTVKPPKPPTLAPSTGRGKPATPTIGRGKPATPTVGRGRPAASKGKPVGEPQLKRRKPPRLDLAHIG